RIVCGNHEEYTLNLGRRRDAYNDLELTILRFTDWTAKKLNNHLADLEAFPFQESITAPDGSEARVVHASMRGNRDGVFPMTTDEELREKIAPAPALLCVGHTHWPLIRSVDQSLVVNVGAVGLPFDRDTRASYAQLTWQGGQWQPEIIRLAYDRAKAEQDFVDTGFLAEGGPLVQLILDELQTARSHLFRWTKEYHPQILAQDISMEAAVEAYISAL
ncbi:MAG: metallophosphoesterase family protein, partial [Chloroflexota bacterium]